MPGPGKRQELYEPFDPDYLRGLIGSGFGELLDRYFRARIIGAEKIPDKGPILMAPNHSGTAFPYDAMVLDGLLWRRDGYRPEKKFRSVFEKQLSLTWWMRPFGIDNFWRRCGGVDLTFENLHLLLERGERVVYYPEGVPGIGKGFDNRYQLQRYSTSFIIHCARNNAPVVPISVVNAEWVIPFCYTFRPIDWLVQKLGVPFLPLPGALIAITFPWAWYMALPARMVFVVGDPIDVAAMCREEGLTKLDKSEREGLKRVAEKVRLQSQVALNKAVESHGRWPYQWRSLRKELWAARKRLFKLLPLGWPAEFIRYERDTRFPPARRGFRRLLRDWDLIGFYLPLGWPLLSLFRALRKPPFGYRGLSREERKNREGAYYWHLARNPLPPREDASQKS